MLDPVNDPGIHRYESAPDAESVMVSVTQKLPPGETTTTGRGFTVKLTVAVFEHPEKLVPVTVYVAEEIAVKPIPSEIPPVHE
jgi:hypothetical protein